MEAYVTRREFENVLKELGKLQLFLTDTFGNKFSDFRKEEDVGGKSDVGEVNRRTTTSVPSCGKTTFSGSTDVRTSASASTGYDNASASENDSEPILEVDPLKMETEDEQPMMPIVVTSTRSLLRPQEKSMPLLVSVTKSVPVIPTVPITLQKPSSTVALARNEKASSIQRPRNGAEAGGTGGWVSPDSFPMARLGPRATNDLPLLMPITITTTSESINKPVQSNKVYPPSRLIRSAKKPASDVTLSKPSRASPLPSFRKAATRREKMKLASSGTTTPKPPPQSSPSSPPTIIQCEHCQLFIYSTQLDEHMKNHSILDDKNLKQNENALIYQQPQTCPLCKEECANFQSYEKHALENHQNRSNGMPCPVCRKTFHIFSRLKRHMLIHTNLKFTCEICGKWYNRKDNLTAHLRTHKKRSQEPTVFYCGICRNNAFSSKEGRDRHMALSHPEENASGSSSSNSVNIPVPSSDTNLTTENNCGKGNSNGAHNLIDFEYEGDEDVVELSE